VRLTENDESDSDCEWCWSGNVKMVRVMVVVCCLGYVVDC